MAAFVLSAALRVEGAQAKAEIEAAKKSVQGLTTATEQQTGKARASASASDIDTAAKRRNAQAARELTTANRQAAGATGNLVAQFNDIGMMIAAGQNPLQMAIQQGTQITQVLGPMGAAGAARALGAAFVSMVNPLNLITLGVIAAGAAMIQWLTSADEDAAAATAEIDKLAAAIEGVVAETEKLRLQRDMMLSGAQSEDEQRVLNEINRLTAERAAVQERLNGLQEIGGRATAFADQAAASRNALQAEIAGLDAKIATLEKQRELNAATEQGRANAEKLRAAAIGIAGALQTADGSRLQAAFAAAFPTANSLLNIAQGIVATLGAAGRGTAQMQFDRNNMLYSGRAGDPRQFMGIGPQPFNPGPDLVREAANFMSPGIGASGAGAGGAAAARDEADALQELIRSLEGEIDALRVQDPIQAEMLRYREALAGATDAERQQVEALIATREREQLLMEGARARAEFFENIGNTALEALIVKGESFNDVLKNIAGSLLQAGIQAALFGEGPFGSLFGGKSLLSMIFPALGAGKAAGGMVHGPGDGTKDTFLTPTANGEFIVNARATARNRHILEAINQGGTVRGFAEGGYVGPDTRRSAARGAGRELPSTIYQDFRGVKGDREIEGMARAAAAQVVAMYDREGLPVSIQRVSADPKRRG